mgnify:FL=1
MYINNNIILYYNIIIYMLSNIGNNEVSNKIAEGLSGINHFIQDKSKVNLNEKYLYKNRVSLEERINEGKKLKERYPEKTSVICERSPSEKRLQNLDKNKYLVPNDLTFGQFKYVIRKRMKVDSSVAIFFLYYDNTMPLDSMLMSQVYEDRKDEDGLVYVLYSSENTYGTN